MTNQEEIEKIRQLNQRGQSEAALLLLVELIKSNPNDSMLWSLKGSIYATNNDYEEALISLDKAIFISPHQAIFYFHRGRYHFESSKLAEAISDFSEALNINNYDDNTFIEELYFYRAESFIRLGKKNEALADISNIREDYHTWTFKLRSKIDLVEDCSKL